MNTYLKLKQKHQEEVNSFPMAFAFNQKQFEEGMKKIGLKPTDTDKVYGMRGTGGFYKKTDHDKLSEMFDRHKEEMKNAIESDKTGDNFIYDMFNYELSNHEYVITYSVDDTLNALGLTEEEVNNNPVLLHGLQKARKAQFNNQ